MQRRLNLMKAVEEDDWCAVIHSQAQHTIKGKVCLLLMPLMYTRYVSGADESCCFA